MLSLVTVLMDMFEVELSIPQRTAESSDVSDVCAQYTTHLRYHTGRLFLLLWHIHFQDILYSNWSERKI